MVLRVCICLAAAGAILAQVPRPTLFFSTYLGGNGGGGLDSRPGDVAYALAADSAGNVYVAGVTDSPDFPVLSPLALFHGGVCGGSPPRRFPCPDAFVAKFAPDGKLLFATYLGGSGYDMAFLIAADAAGNVYVAGHTDSRDFPTTPSAWCRSGPGGFLVKLNAEGSAVLYATIIPAYPQGLAVDSTGHAFLTGLSDGDLPATPGVLQPRPGGNNDAFVLKLNPSGSAPIYSTYLGGPFFDQGRGIAVDRSGHAVVTGSTSVTLDSGAALIAKLSPDGSRLLYSTRIEGNQGQTGVAIAVDVSGDAYITGDTRSTDLPPRRGVQSAPGGDIDGFVARLDPGGGLRSLTYLGGRAAETPWAIGLDANSNVYVAGDSWSDDFPMVNPLAGAILYEPAFVTKLSPDLDAIRFSTKLGGRSYTSLRALALDGAGLWIAGSTTSRDFPLVRPLQPVYAGGVADAFVARIVELPATLPPRSRRDRASSFSPMEALRYE